MQCIYIVFTRASAACQHILQSFFQNNFTIGCRSHAKKPTPPLKRVPATAEKGRVLCRPGQAFALRPEAQTFLSMAVKLRNEPLRPVGSFGFLFPPGTVVAKIM